MTAPKTKRPRARRPRRGEAVTTRRDVGAGPARGRVLGHAWAIRRARPYTVSVPDALWAMRIGWGCRHERYLWITKRSALAGLRKARDGYNTYHLVRVTFRGV